MKTYDLQRLGELLNGLAETFDKKAVPAKALEIWFDTLKEFPAERVFPILSGWAKHHGKFPAPAEVWKAMNDVGIEDRERQAAFERAQARAPVMFQRSDAGKRAVAEIKTILGAKPTPREHWHRILSTHPAGSIGHDYATAALAILNRKYTPPTVEEPVREPGEDALEAA